MELLFLIIIMVIFVALNWVAENIVLITGIIVALFSISILRNFIELVQNKREENYIDGELIAFIIVKVVICLIMCFGVKALIS